MAMTTNEMETRPLPDGWAWTTIGEITQPIEKIMPQDEPEREFTYLDISGIDSQRNIITEPKIYYGGSAPSRARQSVKGGDVLFSTVRPYLKNIAQVPEKYGIQVASTGFSVLRGYEQISNKYLFYYTLTDVFLTSLGKLQRGSSYPAVRDGDVREQLIPLAPFAEQERIVAEIEKQFTRLDQAIASLHHLQTNLAHYKSSILKAACEGRLVPQDPNDEPASELLQRILTERRTQWQAAHPGKKYLEPTPADTSNLPDLPNGWSWATIDQLSWVVRGASPRPAGDPKYFGGNIPWITVGSLTIDGQPYLYSVDQFVTEAGKEKSRYVEPETLLLTNSGATLGVPKITKIGGCINDGSVALLGVQYPLKLYLYYFLSSITKTLRAINQGAAQPNLNTGIVKSIVVPLPAWQEQQRIIVEVEQRLSVITTLEQTLTTNLSRAERLRQAILHRAFTGQLIPQNPNDESAAVLLSKIQAEREKKDQETRSEKKKSTREGQKAMITDKKRRSLYDTLKETSPLSGDELFSRAGFQQDQVELFYEELRDEVLKHRINIDRLNEIDVVLRIAGEQA